MRTVRSEPCIRKVNRETIQRQRGQPRPDLATRGRGARAQATPCLRPSARFRGRAPCSRNLGERCPSSDAFFGCTLHEASRTRVPAGHSGFAFIEASFRWRAEASFRWRAEASCRWRAGEINSALDDRPCSPDDRPHPLEDQQHPRKDRTRYAHARWRIRRTDRRLRKGLPTTQPAAAWATQRVDGDGKPPRDCPVA
jgi:hypothetical protein